MFPRLYGLRAVRIALEDFTPGSAVVGKPFRRPIEKKRDAFAVVAIEAVVIQVVTEFRRADWRQFVFREAPPGVVREFIGHVFGFARVHREHFRAQERLRKRIEKSLGAHDAIEFVRVLDQRQQSPVVSRAPGHDHGVALQPTERPAAEGHAIKLQTIGGGSFSANRNQMTATQTLQQFCGEIGRGSQRREPLVNYHGDAATRR